MQVFILPFLIYPTACSYKTGKSIITFETSASVKAGWKQLLSSRVIKSEERDPQAEEGIIPGMFPWEIKTHIFRKKVGFSTVRSVREKSWEQASFTPTGNAVKAKEGKV